MNTKLLSDKSNNKTGFRSSPKAERTLCEMIVWSFTNEYLPLKRGANVPDAERKLAYKWIRLRRVHKFPSDPLRERIDKIEKLFKSKRTNPKRTLCEMVVWSFMHECFPRQEGANIPDYEKDLVREWYSLQYRYKSPNNPLRERIDKIEKLFKSKKIDPEQTLCEMVVWSFTHEYLPTRDTANVPYYEENLRHRWGALQSSYESLTAPLRERIDKIKKNFKSKKTDAEQTLCEMVVWSFTHEYFPRRKGANVPDAEKDLERRWGKVQPNHKSPTDPLRGRIDKIKRFFKRKWTLIGPEQIIYEMVVWSFTHEYLPQQRMGNISNYERKLRQRWENLLQRYKSLVNSWRERTDSILSWVDSIDSLFKKMRNRGSRHLDTRSATGEQLASLAQEPREIVYHKDFLRQGTAILEGYFQTDRTNGFNPDGF
ncbi:MAG: hypothetical protein LBJ25_00940, partial [Candidatus Margulisbacteria bacterium]|nr:hypothetical protein [Candidatus Margulisiibacteriota bacterium]